MQPQYLSKPRSDLDTTTDMPLRGMSAHTAARYCRVIGGWGSESTASSTHENENPANNNFAQGVHMPRQTAKSAGACSPTDEISV